ncbi:MAG: thiamine phosphate synthase [Clostridiales bacterium]|nr:thiamine phosphate synthase [Clostridiales bacterium]
MSMRKKLDISKYFVIGPENTMGRPVSQMIHAVVDAGFTCIQLRSKEASAKTMIELAEETAEIIAQAGKSDKIALLVDDRLDVVLAARRRGVKVDGIHVGQTDIPVDVCRYYLGEDSIVGLSARSHELFEYIQTADVSGIDYFGGGPLRPSVTKLDCGRDDDGKILTRSFADLRKLAQMSPIPVVIGGGVYAGDLPELAATGVDGFFVVSAIASAKDPYAAAKELADVWDQHKIRG